MSHYPPGMSPLDYDHVGDPQEDNFQTAKRNQTMKRSLVKYARESNHQQVNNLLADGADPNAYLSEPVRIAIKKNDLDMLNIFLKNGYKPSANNSIAFVEAIKSDNVPAFKLMLRIEKPDLSILASAKKSNNPEIIQAVNASLGKTLIR